MHGFAEGSSRTIPSQACISLEWNKITKSDISVSTSPSPPSSLPPSITILAPNLFQLLLHPPIPLLKRSIIKSSVTQKSFGIFVCRRYLCLTHNPKKNQKKTKSQGKLAEAEKMYTRLLQGREEALGPKHASTLSTANNLGILYADQGKLAEAEQMYIRALQGYEEVL